MLPVNDENLASARWAVGAVGVDPEGRDVVRVYWIELA